MQGCRSFASVCRSLPTLTIGFAAFSLPLVVLLSHLLPKHTHREYPSVQALPAHHRLFEAMQGWTATPWSHANAAAETPSRPHVTEATLVQLPDTQVDTQTDPRTTNQCTDTGLPTAQATPRNELTESDIELLAACELYDALTHTPQPRRPRAPTTWNSLWMRYIATTMHQHQPCKSTMRQARIAWKTGCPRPPGNTSTYTCRAASREGT